MKKTVQNDAGTLLERILSPADAQSLVKPPPDHAPQSGPGVSTPLTGNLTAPPSQATPSRQGLAGYFETNTGSSSGGNNTDRSTDPAYVKVASNGQVGYLPRANLARAQQIDPRLKILGDPR